MPSPLPPRSAPHLAWLLPLCLSACAPPAALVVRGAMPLMEGGRLAINRETDLVLAEAAMPATIKLLEGMLLSDPGNLRLRSLHAEALYGYTWAFVEPQDAGRAAGLYRRCLEGMATTLPGLPALPGPALDTALQDLGRAQVPLLFWTAACQAKWIDQNRDNPRALAALGRTAALMQRVLTLDETYYHAGAHSFFGVYHGGRAELLGGDHAAAARHFERARRLAPEAIGLTDTLQAEFLDRQRLDQAAFHARLQGVLQAPPPPPEHAFIDALARQRAQHLLDREAELF